MHYDWSLSLKGKLLHRDPIPQLEAAYIELQAEKTRLHTLTSPRLPPIIGSETVLAAASQSSFSSAKASVSSQWCLL